MTRTKIAVVLAAIATIAAGMLAVQTTGVLASWQSAIWGTSTFARADVTEGYARSLTGRATIDRVITTDNVEATRVTHTHDNPGTSTVTDVIDTSGLLGITRAEGAGTSTASYTASGNATGSASATMNSFEIYATALSSSRRVQLTAPISASAVCTADSGPTVTAPAGGTMTIGSTTVAVPAAGTSTDFTAPITAARLRGTLTSYASVTGDSALSALRLQIGEYDLFGTNYWTIDALLVRAECGLGAALPDVDTFAAPMSSVAEETRADAESSTAEATGDAAVDDENTEESDLAPSDSVAESPSGPNTMTTVQRGVPFDLIATDGTELGRATVHDVVSTAGDDGIVVAVRMSVDTSAETGGARLSRMSADDVAHLVSGRRIAVGSAETDRGTMIPATLHPESTYTGWFAFTVGRGGGSAVWQPSGTAGWMFALPSTVIAPEITTPGTTPESVTPEGTTPEVTEPEVTTPDPGAPEAGAAETTTPGTGGAPTTDTAGSTVGTARPGTTDESGS